MLLSLQRLLSGTRTPQRFRRTFKHRYGIVSWWHKNHTPCASNETKPTCTAIELQSEQVEDAVYSLYVPPSCS